MPAVTVTNVSINHGLLSHDVFAEFERVDDNNSMYGSDTLIIHLIPHRFTRLGGGVGSLKVTVAKGGSIVWVDTNLNQSILN